MDDLILFPVAEWEIGTIPSQAAVFIRFGFLTHLLQKPEEADPGRRYVFQAAQARDLRDAIDRALRSLENAGPPRADSAPH